MNLKNCSVDEFSKKLNSRRLFCIGASVMPLEMCTEYSEYHFEDKIICFADNASDKENTKYILCSREIPIISIEYLKKIISQKDILLITSKFYVEIFEQLNKIKEFDNIDCYIWTMIAPQYKSDSFLVEKIEKMSENGQQIPKIIHYFWFGNHELPILEQKCIRSWSERCPDYKIKRWDESNYDIFQNLYIKQAYEAQKWGFVSDYARLDILYRYGGIYLDTDVEVLKSFDSLLKLQSFIGFESKNLVATGLGIGARKNHPFIKRLMDDYSNRKFLLEDNTYDMTPCPIIQTETFKKYGLKLNNKIQKVMDVTVLPAECLSPDNNMIPHITSNTFTLHHFSGSWTSNKNQELLKKIREFLGENLVGV